MQGMIHRDVIEGHGHCFVPGTVLVLKNVHVIMTPRSHYVVVNTANLVTAYKQRRKGPGPGTSAFNRFHSYL